MTALHTGEAALRRAPDDPEELVTVSGAEAAALVAELDQLRDVQSCTHPRVTRRLDGGLRCEYCRTVVGWMRSSDVPGRAGLNVLIDAIYELVGDAERAGRDVRGTDLRALLGTEPTEERPDA